MFILGWVGLTHYFDSLVGYMKANDYIIKRS